VGSWSFIGRFSRPYQSSAIIRFDQIEALGIMNLDVPIEAKLKTRFSCPARFYY
jgi:hypothetical protein